jgi:hypothetical protein
VFKFYKIYKNMVHYWSMNHSCYVYNLSNRQNFPPMMTIISLVIWCVLILSAFFNLVSTIQIGQPRLQYPLLASCNFWWLPTCLKVWKHKTPTFKRCIVLCVLFLVLMTQPPHAVQLIRTLSSGCGPKTLWITKDFVYFANLSHLPGWGVGYCTDLWTSGHFLLHMYSVHTLKQQMVFLKFVLWWVSV